MEDRRVALSDTLGVVRKEIYAPIDERARRLGSDRSHEAVDFTWVSNYQDWGDVFGDLKQLVHKPLNLLRRLYW